MSVKKVQEIHQKKVLKKSHFFMQAVEVYIF